MSYYTGYAKDHNSCVHESSTTVILLNHILFVIHHKHQIPSYSTVPLHIPHPRAGQVFSPFRITTLCMLLTEKHLDFQALLLCLQHSFLLLPPLTCWEILASYLCFKPQDQTHCLDQTTKANSKFYTEN